MIRNAEGLISSSQRVAVGAEEREALDIEKGEIKTAEDLQVVIDNTLEQIKQRPDDPKLYSKLGDLYKQGNNYEDAKRAYEMAQQKDPNNPTKSPAS